MKRSFLTSALALLAMLAVPCHAQDYEGESPQPDTPYFLLNVGTGMFLSVDDGTLTLTAADAADITATEDNTEGYRHISALGQQWCAGLWTAPSLANDDSLPYNQWLVQPVEGKEGVCVIACRNREASAAFYLYYNAHDNALALMPQKPGESLEAAQWKFVDQNATAIDDTVTAADDHAAQTTRKGVFAIDGKTVNSDGSTTGLGKGLYIINGRKQAR